MSWGEIRMFLDSYQDEMQRLEKMYVRRAEQRQTARPTATRWPVHLAGAWIKRLTLRLRAIGKHQRRDVSTAPSDLIRQG